MKVNIMNRMKYILSLLVVVANMLACDDGHNPPAPVGYDLDSDTFQCHYGCPDLGDQSPERDVENDSSSTNDDTQCDSSSTDGGSSDESSSG